MQTVVAWAPDLEHDVKNVANIGEKTLASCHHFNKF